MMRDFDDYLDSSMEHHFFGATRSEMLHMQADRLANLEPRHRGTGAGKFVLDRIKLLRERAYQLEEQGE
jgi:hypothetical protein